MSRHACWLAQQSAEKALKDETQQAQRTAGDRLALPWLMDRLESASEIWWALLAPGGAAYER